MTSYEGQITNYSDDDETFVLFDEVLTDYLGFVDLMDKIKVTPTHERQFMGLEQTYDISKSEIATNWNYEERMADALAFYKSAGVIETHEDGYYIVSSKLKSMNDKYNDFKKSRAYVKDLK